MSPAAELPEIRTRWSEVSGGIDAAHAYQQRFDALAEQGWEIPESQANFVWLPLGDDALAFAAAADQEGLVVRPFDGDGVRCTIGEVEANDRLIDVVTRFYAG